MSGIRSVDEFKNWFEANILDGDKLVPGQTMVDTFDVYMLVNDYMSRREERLKVKERLDTLKDVFDTRLWNDGMEIYLREGIEQSEQQLKALDGQESQQ